MHGPAVARIQRAGVLRVASDLSYPPMEFWDGRMPRGFEIDLASLFAAALGVRLEVVDLPAAVLHAGFPPGVDMLLGALSPDRAPGLSSEPYYLLAQAILSRTSEPVRAPETLRGLRVAVQAGSPGAAVAEQAGAASLVALYLPDEALGAVAAGRAQAAVADRPLVVAYARAHPNFQVTAVSGQEVPLVVVVGPDAPDLVAFVSIALRDLTRSGGLAQLRKRWDL
jgi:polar amino acid transport system substrate-binding protein